ncbi:MAG: amidohydrolase family protein, partial [Eubacterium sp.]
MKTVFKNCILLDGTKNMAPIEHTDVVTNGDKIVFIGKAEIGAGDRVFDLNGKYLMPGLINLHVHLPAGGKPQKKPLKATLLSKIALSSAVMRNFTLKMCHSYAMQGLMSGVTTIRTVGGLDNIDTKLRDKINSGALEGPRILASDFAI